jgi:cytochrome c biogenesis protein CcmG/thiol:disulfide interchange protein DsbE
MSLPRTIFLLILFTATSATARPSSKPEQAKPWLGVRIETVPPPATGVIIKEVLSGTPAQEAGLMKDDLVQSIDQQNVNSPEAFIKAVQSHGIGTTVTVAFIRAGKPEKKSIKLVARPDQLEMLQQSLVGKLAPPFDLPVVYGPGPGSTAALKGRVVVVEFWATWCPACRSTHKGLSDFAKRHPKDVAVVAISDESRDELLAYAKVEDPAFTILQEADHQASSAWMVSAIPELAVINREGKVVFATIGGGTYLAQALAAAERELRQKQP